MILNQNPKTKLLLTTYPSEKMEETVKSLRKVRIHILGLFWLTSEVIGIILNIVVGTEQNIVVKVTRDKTTEQENDQESGKSKNTIKPFVF